MGGKWWNDFRGGRAVLRGWGTDLRGGKGGEDVRAGKVGKDLREEKGEKISGGTGGKRS